MNTISHYYSDIYRIIQYLTVQKQVLFGIWPMVGPFCLYWSMVMLTSTQLLTVRDVARILRLNPLTVYGYIRSRQTHGRKIWPLLPGIEEDLQEFITEEAHHGGQS